MHIPDGILTWPWIIIWFIVAAVFVAIGAATIVKKRKKNPAIMSIIALMGAAVFIISVWHIPIALPGIAGSGHPTGTGLAAIVIGPFATVVVTLIAIFFQMFLGHGGLTTIGANTVSMGIVGGFSGYAVYWVARKLHGSYWLSAGLAGFFGDLMTYAMTSFQLAISVRPEFWLQQLFLNMIAFSFVQIPIAIIEFAFTAVTIQYIVNHKPEILKWWHA